jgi:Na+/citrate or Na+/malate symporter
VIEWLELKSKFVLYFFIGAFAKNIGKKKIFFNLHGGGGSTFLLLGSSQIINGPPKKKKKKTAGIGVEER